jgi:cytoskeleton protein RodZ
MPGLGDEFRAAREARHLALADVSDQIHIRSVYLQSIEEEDWAAIAAPVYVRGFIRTYARFLGMDPEGAVEAYNADMEDAEREADGPVRVAPARRRGPSIWMWLTAAAALVLLCFVGYSYYQLQTSGAAATPVPAEDLGASAAPASASPASALAASPEASGTEAPAAAAVASPESTAGDLVSTPGPSPSASPLAAATLEVNVTDRAWVRVDVDGKRQMEGIYPPGTTKSFQGHGAYIRTGNAGGVELVVDGKSLGKMGHSGAVVEKTYTLGEE